jgi:hypothetical protein
MRHVFGLTIPHFYWNSAIPESLRVDYLVIANTAKELSYTGDLVKFYLVVMNNGISTNIIDLQNKFDYKGNVDISFVSPDYTDFQAKMKILGNLASESGGKFVISEQLAQENRKLLNKFARAVGKRCLKRTMAQHESTVKELKEKYLHPSGLNWDYYGVES